jgi:hypothetical protein
MTNKAMKKETLKTRETVEIEHPERSAMLTRVSFFIALFSVHP